MAPEDAIAIALMVFLEMISQLVEDLIKIDV